MAQKIIVGIDPGKSGAVCVLTGTAPTIVTTPTVKLTGTKRDYNLVSMRALLAVLDPAETLVVIERTGVRPGEGVVSAHSIGWGAGLWTGMLVGLQLPYLQVAPTTWRAALLKGMPKAESPKQRKEQAALVAGQLFPRVSLRGPRGGLLDGHADALLLAEYGRRLSA